MGWEKGSREASKQVFTYSEYYSSSWVCPSSQPRGHWAQSWLLGCPWESSGQESTFDAGDVGSIPGLGTKIPHVSGQRSLQAATAEPMNSGDHAPLPEEPVCFNKDPMQPKNQIAAWLLCNGVKIQTQDTKQIRTSNTQCNEPLWGIGCIYRPRPVVKNPPANAGDVKRHTWVRSLG